MKTRVKNLFTLLVLLTGIHQIAAKAATVFPIATNHAVVEFGWNIAFGRTNYLASYVSGTEKVVQLISTNGALLGSPIVVGTNVSFGASGVLAFGTTNYLAVWSDISISGAVDMFGQFISQGGAKVGSTFQLLSTPDYNDHGYGFQTVEALATDGTNFLVGWQDGNSGNFFGQLVTPSGTLSGQEFLVSSGQSGNANTGGGDSIAIAFGRTNYLAVWQSQNGGSAYQTYGELISHGGVAGSTFQINQTASVDGYNPINVAFDGTNYLAAWNWDAGAVSGMAPENWEIFGRLVSQTGTFPGNELQLVTEPGSQILPQLAFDGANYLMAWGAGSFNAQASNPTVHFQFFSRSGSPAGPEFTVFNAQGTNSPLLAGLVFDGTRFAAAATLGTISTRPSGSVNGFPSAEVFGAFIPASTTSPTVTASNPVGTQFTIQLSGTPGINYVIQFSTNLSLSNWTTVATNSPTNGTFSFTDTSATNQSRFYRAVEQ